MSDWDWGSVPEWIAAVGTAGALLATSFVLWRQERDRRVREASGVSVWWTYDRVAKETLNFFLTVKNNGSRGIYEIWVRISGRADGPSIFYFPSLGPDAESTTQRDFEEFEWMFDEPERAHVLVEFLDSDGKRWQRDNRGRLKTLTVSEINPG